MGDSKRKLRRSETVRPAAGAARGTGDLTTLLRRWRAGDPEALEKLWPQIQSELKRIARTHLRRERRDHLLQPTALVNETFLRLARQQRAGWQDQEHFLSVASTLMRRVLVDHARRQHRRKRGGDAVTEPFDENAVEPSELGELDARLLSVDLALKRLARLDSDRVKLVQLKYFVGFSIDETASALGWSRTKVIREWRVTKAWLQRELVGPDVGQRPA